MKGRLLAVIAIAAMIAVAVVFVVVSVRRPTVATYAPTPPSPRDAGRALVGPVLYTVDATDPERWRYFSFGAGSVLENAGPREWDLAFRRYQIIANGGPRFAGGGGVVDLGSVPFADVTSVPEGGYQATEGDAEPRNPALAAWYSYSYFSHVLTPRPRVWAVRLADGRYAKVEFVSYYCPNLQPGCLTFRYVFQGDGSRELGGGLRPPSDGRRSPLARSSLPPPRHRWRRQSRRSIRAVAGAILGPVISLASAKEE